MTIKRGIHFDHLMGMDAHMEEHLHRQVKEKIVKNVMIFITHSNRFPVQPKAIIQKEEQVKKPPVCIRETNILNGQQIKHIKSIWRE